MIRNLLATEIDRMEQETANHILNLTNLESFANSIKIADSGGDEVSSDPPSLYDTINSFNMRSNKPNLSKLIISFTDFENLIPPFCSLHTDNIINWLAHFDN